MTFSLVIFLYAYYVFLVFWAILSLIGFYHLLRFGGRMFGSFFVGFLYIIGTLMLLFFSYYYLSGINWQTEITIFQNLSNIKDTFSVPSTFN